jgi:hypothetical protein
MIKEIIVLTAVLFCNSLHSQKSLNLDASVKYDFNFWDNIENYSRKPGLRNYGGRFGLKCVIGKIGTGLELLYLNQDYSDISESDNVPPWKVKKRNYFTQILGAGTGVEFRYSLKGIIMVPSVGISLQKFHDTKSTIVFGDGRLTSGNLDISKLNPRWVFSTGIGLSKGLGKSDLFLKFSQFSVISKMHDAITPPITNLEANSKTGVSFEFGWSYRLIKWQGK